MGGGGFGRAYASGSNTQINQAALAKAAARAPKTVASVIKDQFVPYSLDWKKDFTDPAGTVRKAGETVDRFNAAGDKVGFTMYLDKPVYDGYGNITSTGVRTKHVPYSEDRVVKKAKADPDFNVANYYEIMTAGAEKSITPEAVRRVLQNHDPNRGELFGTSPRGYLMDQQVGDPFIETIRSKQIPLTKKLDTPFKLDYDYGYHSDKLYMKQPPLLGNTNLQQGFTDEERKQYRDLMKRGSFVDISGGTSRVGEYTMAWVEDPPEPSGFSKFLNNPVLSVIGAINPVIGLATTGVKLATGEKVSPMEIASGLMTGLNMAGVVKPPVPNVAGDKGTGLFGSTYGQTQTALNVAAAGDAKGAAFALVGDDLIKGGLDNVGLDRATIERAGIQYDDFQAGIGKVVSAVAGGAELDNALASGLGTYIREGGTLGSIDLPETNIDLGIIEDLAKELANKLEPIGDALSAADTAVRQGLSEFDDEVLQELTQPVGDVLSSADTAVRQNLATFDEEVLQPITQPVGDFIEDVGQAIGDAFDGLNVPNFNPNLGQFRLVSDTGVSVPSPTRTTDQIFGDDLFKFETEIGISYPNEEEYVDLEANPFNDSLELELTYPDSTEESDGFFEGTIYEQQPRSYNF